ncbi:ferrous iron transport protein A [Rhodobacteraceae bacterium RKSG542]|uniref:FeoA family protein n=1 Tax=Pseudovibrio flavus TaxID=2529854 RepID=UPI0012BD33AE|nr:ferrous iron transport protein A [Pseudovibrio flavus]MTI17474.1 ferrous iron transport protein A [Pseudovibrio flavus]
MSDDRKQRSAGVALFLNDVLPGQRVLVKKHHSAGAIRQRLMDLGLLADTPVDVVRTAPLKDPIQIQLDTYNVALRRAEAATIEVVEIN